MFNPNEHMMQLKGRDYLQVAWRLVWFRDEENGKPGWSLETEMLEHGDDWAVFRCKISDENGRVVSTGHGSESRKDFGDYLEKAETKAVGRALAMLGYGTQFAADELDEGERIVDSPIDRTTKMVCSDCGKPIKAVKIGKETLPPLQVSMRTTKTYGRPLCYECSLTAKALNAKTAYED